MVAQQLRSVNSEHGAVQRSTWRQYFSWARKSGPSLARCSGPRSRTCSVSCFSISTQFTLSNVYSCAGHSKSTMPVMPVCLTSLSSLTVLTNQFNQYSKAKPLLISNRNVHHLLHADTEGEEEVLLQLAKKRRLYSGLHPNKYYVIYMHRRFDLNTFSLTIPNKSTTGCTCMMRKWLLWRARLSCCSRCRQLRMLYGRGFVSARRICNRTF